jgi:hypothetical protein
VRAGPVPSPETIPALAREQFPALTADPEIVYLDSAATTQKPRPVSDAVTAELAGRTASGRWACSSAASTRRSCRSARPTRSTPRWSSRAGTACWPAQPPAPATGQRGSSGGGSRRPRAHHTAVSSSPVTGPNPPCPTSASAVPTCSGRRAGLESAPAAGLLPDAHWPQVQLTQVQLAQVHFGLPQLRAASPQLHSTQLHGSQVHAGFSQVVGVLMTVFPSLVP